MIVKLKDITKSFKNNIVLQKINLELKPGKIPSFCFIPKEYSLYFLFSSPSKPTSSKSRIKAR